MQQYSNGGSRVFAKTFFLYGERLSKNLKLTFTFYYNCRHMVLSTISKRIVVKWSKINNKRMFCYILEIKICCITTRFHLIWYLEFYSCAYWDTSTCTINNIEQLENVLSQEIWKQVLCRLQRISCTIATNVKISIAWNATSAMYKS